MRRALAALVLAQAALCAAPAAASDGGPDFKMYSTPSESMLPTLNPQDLFFVDLKAYQFLDPVRGDIIVLDAPHGPWVKRIVGLPGDHVRMTSGMLFLNGVAVPKSPEGNYTSPRSVKGASIPLYRETLPGGRTYRTLDARADDIGDDTPEVTVPADCYFVLGDNRDESIDSRNTLGFIKRADILGKVLYRVGNTHGSTKVDGLE